MNCVFSGFGYTLYEDKNWYNVVNGEGDVVAVTDTTFEGKKWMKDHKTSKCWRADGKWDWSRENM